MKLLDLLIQPIVALLVRRVVAEAEVQTAIRCAESLQQAYARADQFEAEGYQQLANELRQQADAVDIAQPGLTAIQYVNSIEFGNSTPTVNQDTEFIAPTPQLAAPHNSNGVAQSMPAPKAKRKRGRPRKRPQ
jgi:hypothetical protein